MLRIPEVARKHQRWSLLTLSEGQGLLYVNIIPTVRYYISNELLSLVLYVMRQ